MTEVVTRIAPSPTGMAHLGTMRTALFNWLFARHHGGKFFLRIEDTDKDRNVEAAIQPIIDGLAWLGVHHDGEVAYQSHSIDRHIEVAHEMVERGIAYYDFTSVEEMEALRAAWAVNHPKAPFRYLDNPWRDGPTTAGFMPDGPPVIRFKAPRVGETTINDLVQGAVTVANDTLDDLIILRSDRTPTYMLAVIVDDHDAGVTHVIRGDDHLTNAFRQLAMIRALGWAEPTYAHIPLILDETGKKLSKRHGAAGLEFYRDLGFLSDAMFNYLLRMGWGHGDHELFSRSQAIKLFDLDGVGKAPARLDQKRLEFLNGTYLRECSNEQVLFALRELGKDVELPLVRELIPLVKERSKTLEEAWNYIEMTLLGPSERIVIDDPLFVEFMARVDQTGLPIKADALKAFAEQIAEDKGTKLKHVVAPIRLAVMGSKVSPPLFESMELIGRLDVTARLKRAQG